MAYCGNCYAPLTPVFPEFCKRHDDDQWNNCLHIYLEGGYGEYIDVTIGSLHRRLCKKCSDELMENPIMKKLYGEWG